MYDLRITCDEEWLQMRVCRVCRHVSDGQSLEHSIEGAKEDGGEAGRKRCRLASAQQEREDKGSA